MDSFLIVVVGFAAGALFGAANSVFGWLKNNEVFDPRKFAVTVITGILGGIGLIFANVSGLLQAQTNTDLFLQLAGLGLMIFGVNEVRTFVSGMVANRAEEQIEE